MNVVFHAHHAVISERMRQRAERALDKIAQRLRRPVTAVVRFEQDGPTRRVEILLQVPRRRELVSEGSARTYGPALSAALARLQRQVRRRKRSPQAAGRAVARA